MSQVPDANAPPTGVTSATVQEQLVALQRAAVALARDLGAQPLESLPQAAQRLDASVLRPLTYALAAVGSVVKPVPEAPAELPMSERLWELARAATRLRTSPDAPAAVAEVAAALQDLACRLAQAEGADLAAERLAELGRMQSNLPPCIQVSLDGPYLVTNATTVYTHLGERIETRPQMALCRCGGSATKPWCDGTHARIGFRGTKDPKRAIDKRDTYPGQQVTVFDNRGICAHSGFCTDRLATVFHAGGDPFVTASGGRMDDIIRAVRDCPSGALSLAIGGREVRELVDQVDREPAIEVSKDGPYRVTGGLRLTDEHGEDVPRAAGSSLEHYSLCRCGQSKDKPFCSGRHYDVAFRDPPAPASPNLFQWAGGFPALRRMTRLFYEKYVPDDAVLAPLLTDMAPDLLLRVAARLGEAFGGPTGGHGAAERAASRHAGRALTEEQRARWVTLMQRCADEAGLPTDPEFRAAFASYLEWESRKLAGPSPSGPVTPWDWTPAGRPKATPGPDADQPAIVLPGPGEPIYFDAHIKPLFRARDRQAMTWAFDLWSYPDVAGNAAAILARLQAGSMPCDGPWASAQVEVFARWVEAGTPESPTGPANAPAAAGGPQPIGGRLGNSVKLRSPAPAGERPLVIEHREPLIYMLCAAAELEHALMCEYLFAAFTLKHSVSEGLTAEQLATAERWRALILGVAKQEMLHLAINCNLVTALGASPHLSRPNLPQPARHYPSGVRLTMLPFSEQALRHFLYLERPEGMDLEDAQGLAALDHAVPIMGAEEIAPHLQEFATVGHLYRSIEAGFRHLADKWGEEKLFVGPGSAQARGELFGWPQLQPITDCAAAVRAIESIVEQGEGPRGDWRNAHFGRFLKVLDEYLAMTAANPGLEVARPVLPALVRPPESGEPVDLITDPGTAAIADLGNVAYEVLLQLLYRLLSHVDETDQQIRILSDVSVRLMFDVIEPLGELLTTLPVGPEHPGRTAGPSFELFYQPDYLLPHRRAAWLLMSEHLTDAADLADHHAAREPRLLPIAEAMRRHAETLRVHSG